MIAPDLNAWIDRGFALALALGLVWSPFWLGGAWRLPWGVNALIFPGLALGYQFARPQAPDRAALVPLALFVAVVLWILLQMAALPLAASSISVNPGASALGLTRLITDASVFHLAASLGRERAASYALLAATAAIAALYSGYGLYLAAAYQNAIPGFQPADGGFEVRSTFVNRNAFAAYAGLGLMSALALLSRVRLPMRRRGAVIEAVGEGAAPVAAGLVILSALIASASRGGALATGVGGLTLAALLAASKRRRRASLVALGLGALALFAGAVWQGGRLAARLAGNGMGDGERWQAYRITLKAIADRPLTGFGYGAFADVFPLYRDASLSPVGVWELVHNAYLEAAVGLGLVFAGALTLALALIAARCLKAALQGAGAASLAACGAAALIAVDALVDYSLEIEAVTLSFMTLLGLGFAESQTRRARC